MLSGMHRTDLVEAPPATYTTRSMDRLPQGMSGQCTGASWATGSSHILYLQPHVTAEASVRFLVSWGPDGRRR